MLKAVGYIRVSTDEQVSGFSLDAQDERLTEPFETKTAPGRLMLNVLGGFAQFEREVNAESIFNRKKQKWRGCAIHRILSYPVYMGNLERFEYYYQRFDTEQRKLLVDTVIKKSCNKKFEKILSLFIPATSSIR